MIERLLLLQFTSKAFVLIKSINLLICISLLSLMNVSISIDLNKIEQLNFNRVIKMKHVITLDVFLIKSTLIFIIFLKDQTQYIYK